MNQIDTNQFIETVLGMLREQGKSRDVSILLSGIEVSAPSLLNDVLTELSLYANPLEEEGVGCQSLNQIEALFEKYKNSQGE